MPELALYLFHNRIFQELYRIGKLHVTGFDIHYRTDCLIKKFVPIFICLGLGIKVAVYFSCHKMDCNTRSSFRVIGKIVYVDISSFST